MGNLFGRGVCPSIIEKMDYKELKYWDEWHEVMQEAEKNVVKNIEKDFKKKAK